MSLLRTLLILVVIYLAVRLLTRYIFPMVVKNAADKAQENMMNKMQEMYRQQKEQNEGEVSIRGKSSRKKGKSDDDGEYVDYEEVK